MSSNVNPTNQNPSVPGDGGPVPDVGQGEPSDAGGQTAPSAATLGLFINKLGDYEPGLVCLIGSFLTPTLSHILTFSRTGSANVAIKSPERTIRAYFARMERNENELRKKTGCILVA